MQADAPFDDGAAESIAGVGVFLAQAFVVLAKTTNPYGILAIGSLALMACSSGKVAASGTGAEEGAELNGNTEGQAGNNVDAPGPPAGHATVRFANWSPDTPSAGYDVCVRPSGTVGWSGPILAHELASVGVPREGSTSPLEYPSVTAYVELTFPTLMDSQSYDLELVAGGATCSTPMAIASSLPTLEHDAFYTVAILGEATPPSTLRLAIFGDDTWPSSVVGLLRVINASPRFASVGFGTVETPAGTFSPLLTDIAFGAAGSVSAGAAGSLDPNDYKALAPSSGLELSFEDMSSPGSVIAATHQNIAYGDITTMVLIDGAGDDASQPPILLCARDGVNSAPGAASPCTIAVP